MRRLALLGAAIAAVLVVMNLAGTALAPAAGGSPGKASPPGQEQAPPGQSAKADEDRGAPEPAEEKTKGNHGKPSVPAESEAGRGEPATIAAEPAVAANDADNDEHGGPPVRSAAHPRSDSQPSAKPRPAAEERAVAKPAKSAGSSGRSAIAHEHVIICHRTGSSSNPYVVINISMEGWLHGHSTHPELDGRSDIVLKRGAEPGEKLSTSACGASGRPTDPGNSPGSKHDPGDTVSTTAAPPVATTVSAAPVQATRANGSQGPKPHRKSAGNQALGAGRLGYVAVQGRLPFTGVALWIVALAGAALLGGGLALRRALRPQQAKTRVTERK